MATEIFFRIIQIIVGILVFLAGRYLWSRHRSTQLDNRQLTNDRSQLQQVVDNLRDGVVVVNDQWHVLFCNEVGQVLVTGTDSYRVLDPSQGVYDLFYDDGRPMSKEEWPLSRALRGIFARDTTVLLRNRLNGEVSVREVSTSPFLILGTTEPHIMVTFRDVTLARRIEEARVRLASIVESSDDAIIGKDIHGIITSWNRSAERIFGYTALEMVGQSITRLMPPDRLDEETKILTRILNDEKVDHFNTTRLTREGRIIHVSLTISPIKDAAGKIVGASKIARDMTGLRDLEEQLRHSQKMEALGQLTGGIAHDFNNLLTIIVGNLDLLEHSIQVEVATREEGRAKIVETLNCAHAAQRAALRGADLTRRLLIFSSKEHLKPVPTLLHVSVTNMLALAERVLGPEIVVETEIDESIPAVIVDPAALETALLNLVVNARDAMPHGGSLRITTRLSHLDENLATTNHLEDSYLFACISVSDNGTGMAPEHLQRAFEPFFTTKSRDRGTGLGLAMVYGFLKQCNGTSRIYSEPGYGTTVSLFLPIPETIAVPVPVVLQQDDHVHRKATILIVDDEPDMLELAREYLSRFGHSILTAGDGPAALQIVSQHKHIDVIVTDIIMPGGMNGAELVQKVQKIMPSIKVIYSSGFPADALASKKFDIAASSLLHKPYRLAELGNLMYRLLSEPDHT